MYHFERFHRVTLLLQLVWMSPWSSVLLLIVILTTLCSVIIRRFRFYRKCKTKRLQIYRFQAPVLTSFVSYRWYLCIVFTRRSSSDHCMVSFVKPSLLGTRREFSNRFVNPITNGQHSDSTAGDVRLMKRRAHVLHEMLEGCVQVTWYWCKTCLVCNLRRHRITDICWWSKLSDTLKNIKLLIYLIDKIFSVRNEELRWKCVVSFVGF